MSGKKPHPDGRVDRDPDGTPAVPWRNRWTVFYLSGWSPQQAGGSAVVGLFFYDVHR